MLKTTLPALNCVATPDHSSSRYRDSRDSKATTQTTRSQTTKLYDLEVSLQQHGSQHSRSQPFHNDALLLLLLIFSAGSFDSVA